jgi:putative Mn2+ efflux pump MntP
MPAQTAELIALVLPLGLDTLGVALALGLAGLTPHRRLHLSFLFAGFEAGMPLIGVAIGGPLGQSIGAVADYLAAALIAALGIYMLIERVTKIKNANVCCRYPSAASWERSRSGSASASTNSRSASAQACCTSRSSRL